MISHPQRHTQDNQNRAFLFDRLIQKSEENNKTLSKLFSQNHLRQDFAKLYHDVKDGLFRYKPISQAVPSNNQTVDTFKAFLDSRRKKSSQDISTACQAFFDGLIKSAPKKQQYEAQKSLHRLIESATPLANMEFMTAHDREETLRNFMLSVEKFSACVFKSKEETVKDQMFLVIERAALLMCYEQKSVLNKLRIAVKRTLIPFFSQWAKRDLKKSLSDQVEQKTYGLKAHFKFENNDVNLDMYDPIFSALNQNVKSKDIFKGTNSTFPNEDIQSEYDHLNESFFYAHTHYQKSEDTKKLLDPIVEYKNELYSKHDKASKISAMNDLITAIGQNQEARLGKFISLFKKCLQESRSPSQQDALRLYRISYKIAEAYFHDLNDLNDLKQGQQAWPIPKGYEPPFKHDLIKFLQFHIFNAGFALSVNQAWRDRDDELFKKARKQQLEDFLNAASERNQARSQSSTITILRSSSVSSLSSDGDEKRMVKQMFIQRELENGFPPSRE